MSNARRPTGIKNLRLGPTLLQSSIKPLAQAPEDPDAWRAGKTTDERGYTYAWKKARAAYLKANPLCVICNERGIVKAASVVDHKIAHRGDQVLFWDKTNWQSLCKPHHDSHAQKRDNEATRNFKFKP